MVSSIIDSYAERAIERRQTSRDTRPVTDHRSPSQTAYGDYTEADRYALAKCARRFLTVGAALAIIDEVYWIWQGEMPNFLVTIAMVLALGGLAIADIVERRADRALS